MQTKENRKQREEEVAKAQMAAALSSGVQWGMGDGSFERDQDEAQAVNVDWRAYCQTHTLNPKQQKLADRARRLENKIRNLTTEADKIKVGLLNC